MVKQGHPDPVPWHLTLFYALGAAGSAAKNAPISAILMLFYNQVVGLPAAWVSAILMLSLCLDAIFDPAIGYFSDHSRLAGGRRLPFMYASALPLTMMFILLWTPPIGWSNQALGIYLALCIIGIRFFDTLFDLPHLALIPEITQDHHQRTRLFTIRGLFESLGGLIIMSLAYLVFLKQDSQGHGGILAREGYFAFAVSTSAFVLTAILTCCLALHKMLPPASYPPNSSPGRERIRTLITTTFRNRQILLLGGATMLISIGSGIGASLNIYWLIYIYQLSQDNIAFISLPIMIGMSLIAFTPKIEKRFGKRNSSIIILWSYFAITATPLLL
jgi:glycoside/pentoside/hexuronide:cation symporter, GPH family